MGEGSTPPERTPPREPPQATSSAVAPTRPRRLVFFSKAALLRHFDTTLLHVIQKGHHLMLVSSVHTIDVGSAAPGQEGSSHYCYLFRENGGFVERAPSVEEHPRQLARGQGGDWDPERIARFTESFVRPRGLDRPATPILASALIDLAGGAGAAPATSDTATEAPTASWSST